MTRTYLDRVYDARTADQIRDLYDQWSASYDAEVAENGYATPRRCAEALAAHMADRNAPVLDFGCGTGLSGLALRAAGFTTVDGIDLSPEMLNVAAGKGIYRDLAAIAAGAAPPHDPGYYAAIAAIGVIGAGAAPVSVLDTLLAALGPGGRLVLSFNDHALADPANEGRIDAHVTAGRARLLLREYGDHLPGIGLKSNVYVLEKL